MAIQLIELRKYVTPELPGIQLPLLDQTILDVAIEFCHETQIWRHDLDPINIKEDVDEYDLDGQPGCAEIDKVTKVVVDDVEKDPEDDYTMLEKTTLKLEATPSADSSGGLEVEVALRPKRTATVICDRIFEDWYQVLAAGVKFRLMSMQAKKWTNANMAATNYNLYWRGVAQARIELNRGSMNQALQAKAKWKFA